MEKEMNADEILKEIEKLYNENPKNKSPQFTLYEGAVKEFFRVLKGDTWNEKEYDEQLQEMKKDMMLKNESKREGAFGTFYYDGNNLSLHTGK